MITIFETFNKKRGIGLIHKVYNAQLKNVRNYLASTKTKSEVRGGGRSDHSSLSPASYYDRQ